MNKNFIENLYKRGKLKLTTCRTFDNKVLDMLVIVYIDINDECNVLAYIQCPDVYSTELEGLLDNEQLIITKFYNKIMEGKLCI